VVLGLWAVGGSVGLRAAEGSGSAALGKCVSESGTMGWRVSPDKPWSFAKQNDPLPGGRVIVGMAGGQLDSKDGAVRLTFRSDLDGRSPYPIIESAVVLKDDPKADLSLILDRGRVDLTNHKAKEAARVRVQVRKATWDLVLADPGTRVALELYGRWPAGHQFTTNPGPKDVPTAGLVILVLKGHVFMDHNGVAHALQAPPGPAMIEWDSVTGQDASPSRLEKLPEWVEVEPANTPETQAKMAARKRFRQVAMSKSTEQALDELVDSPNPVERRLAVFAMGAVDDLGRLGKALRETKHQDVWDNGVIALRHWIGRGPGQDQILFKRLQDVAGYSPVHAETVMQLLHSFGTDDLAHSETYQTLIDYLAHDKLAIRGLAHWHLVRLVPAGKDFGYSPFDPQEKREEAIKKWRKLIPKGKLPPAPKPEKKTDKGKGK
jgi:hypothetical protein